MGEEAVQDGTEHTTLWCTCAQSNGGRCVGAQSHCLGPTLSGNLVSSCRAVDLGLAGEVLWSVCRDDSVECRAIVHEQNPHVRVLSLQVIQSSVQSQGDGVLCEPVHSKLGRVRPVWSL